jgi:hypothetical protein
VMPLMGTCARHGQVEVGPMGECPLCGDYIVTKEDEDDED